MACMASPERCEAATERPGQPVAAAAAASKQGTSLAEAPKAGNAEPAAAASPLVARVAATSMPGEGAGTTPAAAAAAAAAATASAAATAAAAATAGSVLPSFGSAAAAPGVGAGTTPAAAAAGAEAGAGAGAGAGAAGAAGPTHLKHYALQDLDPVPKAGPADLQRRGRAADWVPASPLLGELVTDQAGTLGLGQELHSFEPGGWRQGPEHDHYMDDGDG